MRKPLVSVHMITYNHEPYISQAIESVLGQRTNFDIELVIGEDCSTDNTRQIVYEYQKKNPEIIKVITSEENVGLNENAIRVNQQCIGKYMAYCEGDDYWTDQDKLQKQVDFLEKNPDYGLVHGDVNHLDEKTGKIIYAYNKTNNISIPEGNIFEDLMKPCHFIKTMTVCFRKELFDKYCSDVSKENLAFFQIDIAEWLGLSRMTKFHYMNEVFATYRLLDESASRSKNYLKLHQFHLMVFEIRKYYLEKYGCNEDLKKCTEIHFNKVLLADGFNMIDFNLARRAIKNLKSIGVGLSMKDGAYYIGSYNILLQKMIKTVNSIFK
jgi:glycosyltransferase involved in cell wall biosynthesis